MCMHCTSTAGYDETVSLSRADNVEVVVEPKT